MILRQSTAVARDGRAILVEGPPGCGKTSLALALIDRGWALVGDDGVSLSVAGGVLRATPPPATTGLIEVRGVGIVNVPATSARVALILVADDNPPRWIERPDSLAVEGIAIPMLRFDLAAAVAPLRAEYALAKHGLDFSRTSSQMME